MKTAIIIGAGPAGLTAAHELLAQTDIKPLVFEMEDDVGGISRTINHKGNRIDIGGHRFFSKSERVMRWWTDMLPLEQGATWPSISSPQSAAADTTSNAQPRPADAFMLVRNRLSRIFYRRCFFDYPISLSLHTLLNLGIFRVLKIAYSYAVALAFPVHPEKTLEDFMVNRFGKELYATFFRDYTAKVWGVKCAQISAEWGAQRIKGLSILATLRHTLAKRLRRRSDIEQKNTETSLIERFLYPKLGPGQMWQETARKIQERGGEIHLNCRVQSLRISEGKVRQVTVRNTTTGEVATYAGDYFFSTMPVSELIAAIEGVNIPTDTQQIAKNLPYRDFITVGLLLNKLHVQTRTNATAEASVPDNWIYIQESDVHLARLQIFNNWSPFMVARPDTVWIGLEYMCNEGDALWQKDDASFIRFAIDELVKINFILAEDVLDATIIRVPKAYPAYFGTYAQFHQVRAFTDGIDNLFLIGRNGMHRYNNQDHSMLSAMTAVENIRRGEAAKDNIWAVNAEQDYHEAK